MLFTLRGQKINFIDQKFNDFSLTVVNQPCSKGASLFHIHCASSSVATYRASRISFEDISNYA